MDLVNFDWERDPAGYEFRDEHRPPIAGTLAITGAPVSTTIIGRGDDLRVLRGRSGKAQTIRPLDGNRALFVELAEAGIGEAGAIAFANEFGLLYRGHPVTMDDWPMTVLNMSASRRYARNRKKFRDSWNANAGQVARAHMRLGPDLEIRLVPDSLVSAAYLQLALHVAKGGQLHACAKCGKPFVTGTGTSKRKTKKYCGGPCRQKAWRARRKV